MKVLTLFVIVLFASLHSGSQPFQVATVAGNGVKDQKPDSLPMARAVRPKVSLQEALKIAEDYIDQQHIDIRPFWLYRASYILSGDEKMPDRDKIPGWHFWWVNENRALGDWTDPLKWNNKRLQHSSRKGLESGQTSREVSGSVPPYGSGADEELRQCECIGA